MVSSPRPPLPFPSSLPERYFTILLLSIVLYIYLFIYIVLGIDLVTLSQMMMESFHKYRHRVLDRLGRGNGLNTVVGEDCLLHATRLLILRNNYMRTIVVKRFKETWAQRNIDKSSNPAAPPPPEAPAEIAPQNNP